MKSTITTNSYMDYLNHNDCLISYITPAIKKTTERITVAYLTEPPKEYQAYCYIIEIFIALGKRSFYKRYIGWHAGNVSDIDTHDYWHSVKSDQFKTDLETSSKIIYNVVAYGTKSDMATLENTLCRRANAISNKRYYNKTNGGGKHVQSNARTTDIGVVTTKKILDNINNNVYEVRTYSKAKLKLLLNNMLDTSGPGRKNLSTIVQSRYETSDPDHINDLKDRMVGKTANTFDPIHVLLHEDSNEPVSVIGGNHSIRAAIRVHTMNGLRAIEIPFADWSKLSRSELRSLGLALNRPPEKAVLSNSLESLAYWMIGYVDDHQLYNATLPGYKSEPNFDHPAIKQHLDMMQVAPSRRGPLYQKARKIHNQRQYNNSNAIDWRDKALLGEPAIDSWLKNHIQERLIEYDVVIKFSAKRHLFEQIEKSLINWNENSITYNLPVSNKGNSKLKILCLVFLPRNMSDADELNWNRQRNLWDKLTYPCAMSHLHDITIEVLPRYIDGLTNSNVIDITTPITHQPIV